MFSNFNIGIESLIYKQNKNEWNFLITNIFIIKRVRFPIYLKNVLPKYFETKKVIRASI